MAGLFGSRPLCSGHPGVLGFPLSFLFFCFFCCLFLDCRVPVLVLAGCSHSGWGIILVPASLHFDIILTLMFWPWVLCLTSRLWFSCVFPSYQPVSLHFGLCPLACCTQCPPLQGGGGVFSLYIRPGRVIWQLTNHCSLFPMVQFVRATLTLSS